MEKVVQKIVKANGIYKECEAIVNVFDKKTIDDDMKEILHITTAASDQSSKIHGWHLERRAANEYQMNATAAAESIETKNELDKTKIILKDLVEKARQNDAKRQKMINDMEAHHETLQLELETIRNDILTPSSPPTLAISKLV